MSGEPNNLLEAFRPHAEPILSRHHELRYVWTETPDKSSYTLFIRCHSDQGFDVGMEVQTYGLYPLAGNHQFAPWDITTPGCSVLELCDFALGFMRRLLSADARLRVRYVAGRPYKWIVEFKSGDSWKGVQDTGLLFYNYFGRRSDEFFQNNILPPVSAGNSGDHAYDKWLD